MASRWLASASTRPASRCSTTDVYALCGDGDMMEGVSSEAASIAGHLKLCNLCWIYDSNRITIEGHTDLAFSDDVAARFKALRLERARTWATPTTPPRLARGAGRRSRRSRRADLIIVVHSHIGYGAPKKAGTRERTARRWATRRSSGAKRNYGWPEDAQFLVPDGVTRTFRRGAWAPAAPSCAPRGERCLTSYRAEYPELAARARP